LSRARHNEWEGWQPDTLVDDRRSAIIRTGGHTSAAEWLEALAKNGVACKIDHWYKQQNYCEVWFEAEAMQRQFEYYVKGVTLRPFSGMPSIDYKYTIAGDLDEMSERYELPIVILYFGDYDNAGMTIPETSEADIRGWCDADFDFIRVGLNEGDGERYGIPDNIDKPGAYQWEALSDETARQIITGAVGSYVDTGIIGEVQREAHKAEDSFRKLCQDAINGLEAE
jgi:hypothetical protein